MIYINTFGPFTKSKGRMEIFKGIRDSRYENTFIDKACFQHNIAYGDFKYLPIRTTYDKLPCGKTFDIVKTTKFVGY